MGPSGIYYMIFPGTMLLASLGPFLDLPPSLIIVLIQDNPHYTSLETLK